jgi:hypothetical protein
LQAFSSSFFAPEFTPAAATSQKRVPVPPGLDLDKWVFKLEPEIESRDLEDGQTSNVSLQLIQGSIWNEICKRITSQTETERGSFLSSLVTDKNYKG